MRSALGIGALVAATLLLILGIFINHPASILVGFNGLILASIFLSLHFRTKHTRELSRRFLARHARWIDALLEPGERITMSMGAQPANQTYRAVRSFYVHVLITDRRLILVKPSFWPWSAPNLVDAVALEEVAGVQRSASRPWQKRLLGDRFVRFGRADGSRSFELAMPAEEESLAFAQALGESAGRLSVIPAGDDRGRLSTPPSLDGALSDVDRR